MNKNNILSAVFFFLFLTNQYAFAGSVIASPSKSNSLEEELTTEEDAIHTSETPVAKEGEESVDAEEKPKSKGIISSLFGHDNQHAMKGLSLGVLAFSEGYTSSVAMVLDSTNKRAANKVADLTYVGGVLRYTVFPYQKIGTDISITMANSMNHSNYNYKAITYTKAEVNFGYSWVTRGGTPTYSYFGFGYESIKSSDLENYFAPGGASIRFGIGANMNKKISLEGVFSMSRHAVGNTLYDMLTTQAQNQGFTTIDFERDKSYITASLIQGRVLVRF